MVHWHVWFILSSYRSNCRGIWYSDIAVYWCTRSSLPRTFISTTATTSDRTEAYVHWPTPRWVRASSQGLGGAPWCVILHPCSVRSITSIPLHESICRIRCKRKRLGTLRQMTSRDIHGHVFTPQSSAFVGRYTNSRFAEPIYRDKRRDIVKRQ